MYLISCLFLYQLILIAQVESYSIPLKTNYASGFEFISNGYNKACLFLNQRDKYYIVLLDSNYRILAEFRDKFYTASTPRFVGSIVENNRFELFFRRVEDDVLLVLAIDAENHKLTRIKNFKITELPKERIIYTGSNIVGNKMISISIAKSTFIYKKHLPGLKTEKFYVQLKGNDKEFINDAEYCQFKADLDSLIIVFKRMKVDYKSPQYRLFNIDFKTGLYNSVDFICELEKRRSDYNIHFYKILYLLKVVMTKSGFMTVLVENSLANSQ